MGDIHGCATALETILEQIRLQPGDLLVTLGDYINKGPDSRQVLERLMQLHRKGLLMPLRGNHEVKLILAAEKKQAHLNDTILVDERTLVSYSENDTPIEVAAIPDTHIAFLKYHCRDWWQSPGHCFVHATVEPQKPLPEQAQQVLLWRKFDYPAPHISGKVLVCGHTPQYEGLPLNIGHAICLDTWACGNGWLSCLEVNSGQLWQANQQKQLRIAHIEDFRESSTPVMHKVEAACRSLAE